MSASVRASTLAFLTALLAACGGGGSSSPPPNTTPFDIDTAVRGIATANETFSMNGSMMGVAAGMVAQHQALPDAAFMGFGTLNRFRRTATVSAAGTSSTSYEDDYIDLAGRNFYGLQDDLGNRSVSTSRTPYPITATIGASGPLYEATHYDANNTVIGGAHATWSLESVADNANAAYLCINLYYLDVNGATTGDREQDCYRISPTGQRLGMRVMLASPAFGMMQFD